MLGVCIVGTGVAGGIHARALKDVEAVRLAAVVDVSPEQVGQFAEKWGALSSYTNLEEALQDPAVDVVHLCTPPFLHERQASLCAAAGKHVLVEKPMARTLAEADAMIANCRRARVALSAVFQHRFLPLPQRVKSLLQEGRLGKLYLGDAYVKWYRSEEYYRAGGWRATRDKEGGGTLMNQAIHSIDLLQWLMGPVSDVVGRTAAVAHDIETEDVGLALLGFENGALGVIEGTTAAYPGFPERIEIHGEKGSVILNEGKNQLEWYIHGETPTVEGVPVEEGYAHDPASISSVGHTAQFRDFYQALQQGRSATVDGSEGRRALEIIEAIYRSAEQGERILLPLS
ncbi:MAG: Gfo/Idh/MocA family oxidoreductase [Bacteroidetes bacterium]|nr:Gfo/Idh/MocA family oxidoreductase [Bacteroidota bacterium]